MSHMVIPPYNYSKLRREISSSTISSIHCGYFHICGGGGGGGGGTCTVT
jgi:hypothetical protein